MANSGSSSREALKEILKSMNLPLTHDASASDDESGGGGAGKRKAGDFKKEKAIVLMEKGKLKAKEFKSFLSTHGMDHNTLKEMPLSSQSEKFISQQSKAKQNMEAHRKSFLNGEKNLAKSVKDSAKNSLASQSLFAQKEAVSMESLSGKREKAKKALFGGSPEGSRHGNPHGFARQGGQIETSLKTNPIEKAELRQKESRKASLMSSITRR